MEDQALLGLLHDLESDRVERKASLADFDWICEAVCAFANDLPDHRAPGVIFVGLHDDGRCAGLAIIDDPLLRMGNVRADGKILPLPSITVQKRVLDGCELAVLIVQPADAPPVRFRGRTWIRVGPRREVASPDEERRLSEKRRSRDLPFDLKPIHSATIDDLDLDLFTRVYLRASVSAEAIAANHRAVNDQLASLRLTTPDGTPTVLGLLVCGKEPRGFIPGAYVQFLRFAGTTLTDPIRHQAEIDGPLSELLRRLDEILAANTSIGTTVVGAPVEVRHPDYPVEAIKQLVRNAVLHRNYETSNAPVLIYWFDDRLEIHSPGGPYGRVTRESFGAPGSTDYRNPHLAEAMKNLGFVRRFGLGIALAREECRRNGNPAPEFEIGPSHILVVMRTEG